MGLFDLSRLLSIFLIAYLLPACITQFTPTKSLEKQFQQALQNYDQGDLDQAFERLQKISANPAAQHLLSLIYQRGTPNIDKDPGMAIAWLQKSAQNGYAAAQYSLGQAYFEGKFINKSMSKARYWVGAAMVQGFAAATDYMPKLYPIYNPKGRYQHASEMQFPEKIGILKRVSVTFYDKDKSSIGINYRNTDIFFSIHIYPQIASMENRLDAFNQEFTDVVKAVVDSRNAELLTQSTTILRGARLSKSVVLQSGKHEKYLNHIYLHYTKGWVVKYNISHKKSAENNVFPLMKEVIAELGWPRTAPTNDLDR